MRVIHAPTAPELGNAERTVFLAGSIDDGTAVNWQSQLAEKLADCPGVLLNPRRANWEARWHAESADFQAQVDWELDGMERAGLIAFYFAPASQAPITLLELGLAARGGKAVVCCPTGYWRRGNVERVCQRYGIPRVATLAELGEAVRTYCEGQGRPA